MAIDPNLDTDENGAVVMRLQPGDMVTGGWCQPCALPSLARVPLYVLSPRGVSLWQVIEICAEEGTHRYLPGSADLLRFDP